jgi:hypothetical protein
MLPFRCPASSVAFHAGATVEALKSDALSPPGPRPEHVDAGLKAFLAETAARASGRDAGDDQAEPPHHHDP